VPGAVNLTLLRVLADGLTGARYCIFNRLGRQLAAENGCHLVKLTVPVSYATAVLLCQRSSLSSLAFTKPISTKPRTSGKLHP
jgi:hypothetical protein